MTYLLDANVLIEGSRFYYAFNLAPGYWDWLEATHGRGDIASVPAVRDEITNGSDQLAAWAGQLPESFWIPESSATVDSIATAAAWVVNDPRDFTDAAQAEFLDSADLRLLAEAHATGLTVVTREISEPFRRNRVKIPDVCIGLTVACENPFPVYTRLGLRLHA